MRPTFLGEIMKSREILERIVGWLCLEYPTTILGRCDQVDSSFKIEFHIGQPYSYTLTVNDKNLILKVANQGPKAEEYRCSHNPKRWTTLLKKLLACSILENPNRNLWTRVRVIFGI